jgi:hypothetical protein
MFFECELCKYIDMLIWEEKTMHVKIGKIPISWITDTVPKKRKKKDKHSTGRPPTKCH